MTQKFLINSHLKLQIKYMLPENNSGGYSYSINLHASCYTKFLHSSYQLIDWIYYKM